MDYNCTIGSIFVALVFADLPSLAVFDWKVQRFCWPKGTSLECAESIYVKTMGPACGSEEPCRWKKKKKKMDKS